MKRNSVLKLEDLTSLDELDYINSIWYAIMKMEVGLLKLILADDIDYEDIGKLKFIEKLNDRFNNHKTHGDSELLLDLDCCKGCNCNKPICKFVGNHSGMHFALFFEMTDEKITDIYHCDWYGDIDFLDAF
ncbi:hypothetical protein [Gaetbulibacter saemankumensis]|uniref:hypothetical protein n=1 Tax=Gaetbulibacter saemankumensis TaxID=311208 RepID=UPI0003FDFE23|nr:hypothetical protein [Gaetbulibacter saemankumensis]